MIEITDAHIADFESRFGLSFDDESKEFIKCLESKDIQACPGAGKTTSLVAKLDIIAQQMPFKDNSGILVLTHTNVAVDEIKAKLGANAKILLSYPNHVGTFQSFVNKYLAIPMYVKLTGKRPERIDDEIFYKVFQEKFDSYSDIYKQWLMDRAEEKYTNVLSFIENFEIFESEIKYSGKNIVTKNSKMFSTIKTISSLPIQIMGKGYLKYDHCYELALKYLNDFPNMAEVFRQRFKYVFVDEVQDTDDRQFEILNKLFSNSDTVVQRIGDKNQEIFGGIHSKETGWIVASDKLEIKNTKRLSSKISEKVTHFAISPQVLNGNGGIEIQPVILLFDEQNIQSVIEEFGNLIIENELHKIDDAKFKAVGAVGKLNKDGKVAIPSYFPEFSKEDNKTSEFDTLIEKFALFDTKSILPQDYRKTLLTIIVEYLKVENIKNGDRFFTATTLLKHLKENHKDVYFDFKLKLFESVQKLNSNECPNDILKEKLQKVLDVLGYTLDEQKLQAIIKTHKLDFTQKTDKNKYKYTNEDVEFDIHISTIHKAKGETHTATLVLETSYYDYDLKQLLPLLKGKSIADKPRNMQKKKLLYVAMSRPAHLLCLAMNKAHIADMDKNELESVGFKIKNI